MKIKGLIVVASFCAILLGSCAKNSIMSSKLVTENDTLSYAIGVSIYKQFIKDSIVLNPLLVARSLMDAKTGKALMTEGEMQDFLMRWSAKMQETQMTRQAEANKVIYKSQIEQSDSFLQKNKERPGVTVTASGLQYEVIKMGTGSKPTASNEVKVSYKGTLIDGTEFDARDLKNPVTFPVTGVIPGWTEALQLMPVGSKFKLYIPENLGYGANGAGGVIKPFSVLIFEVELLEIVK